jgi:hypothetical protein
MTWDEQLIELFCNVDDFCQDFEPEWNKRLINCKKKIRSKRMSLSEVMTITIHFHQSGYRTFKKYYSIFVKGVMKIFFPNAVSYGRFVELMQGTVFPLFCFLQTQMGKDTGISFVDSTDLTVCHIKRSYSNKTFRGMATKGKTTTGWFFGFKLHIVINDEGELLAWQLTSGNTDDRKPVASITGKLRGLLFGDKGYISKTLFDELYERGLKLITRLRSNMKNKLMSLSERLLLKRRGLVESVNDQLKNIAQIEHSRHRSVWNFLSNLMGGLLSYTFQTNKPSLNLRNTKYKLLEMNL